MTLLTLCFDIILGIINGVLFFIPTLSLPTNVTTIFNWFFELIEPGAYFVDMKSFFQCTLLLLSVFIVKLLLRFFNFFVAHVPFLKIGILHR